MRQFLTYGDAVKEIPSTLTSKGQVTIPIEVRRHLGLNQGDKVIFVIEDEGNCTARSLGSTSPTHS
ncbi:MAG: hypothetical protein DLM70_12420 [Chloroflexi bacterium]|nr:MAG: hypothetical protein DLM70_12420 [Chloroflexota bacterium]